MASSCAVPSPCANQTRKGAVVLARRSRPQHPVEIMWMELMSDFDPSRGGDMKILRALGRTALVNAVVAASALSGGMLAGMAGLVTGGAITANRVGTGLVQQNHKEVAKGLAVFGSATTASVSSQLVAVAVMVGVAGASLPVAGAVAFGVGCTSGITAGALSEWGVDNAWENLNKKNKTDRIACGKDLHTTDDDDDDATDTTEDSTDVSFDDEDDLGLVDADTDAATVGKNGSAAPKPSRDKSFLELFFDMECGCH